MNAPPPPSVTNAEALRGIQRLCHVIKRTNFDGYGFNLHSEKGKPGQYIGKIDKNSPAESAGLREGDRIIEVNGVKIGSETHKQVVQRIKAILNEVQLLVIDPAKEKEILQTQKTMLSATAETVKTININEPESEILTSSTITIKSTSTISSDKLSAKEHNKVSMSTFGKSSPTAENLPTDPNGIKTRNKNTYQMTEHCSSLANASISPNTSENVNSINIDIFDYHDHQLMDKTNQNHLNYMNVNLQTEKNEFVCDSIINKCNNQSNKLSEIDQGDVTNEIANNLDKQLLSIPLALSSKIIENSNSNKSTKLTTKMSASSFEISNSQNYNIDAAKGDIKDANKQFNQPINAEEMHLRQLQSQQKFFNVESTEEHKKKSNSKNKNNDNTNKNIKNNINNQNGNSHKSKNLTQQQQNYEEFNNQKEKATEPEDQKQSAQELEAKQKQQLLKLPMTAAEMRAKLLAKKKYDPKNDTVDLRKKFEIIQKL